MARLAVLAAVLGLAPGCSLLFSSSSHVSDASADGACTQPNDDDRDGFRVCDGDCDDSNELVYPGAAPVCNNGVVESCGIPADLRLLGFLGGGEMGFTLQRVTLASRSVERISLSLTPGRGNFPIVAVVTATDGTVAGTQWFAQNMVRADAELPMLTAQPTETLLDTPAVAPDVLSAVAAHDFGTGVRVFAGLASGMRVRARRLQVLSGAAEMRVSATSLTAVPTAMASVGNGLGAEELGTHVLFLTSGRLAAFPANPASTDPLTDYAVSFVPSVGDVRLRAATDGSVVIQNETPVPFGLFRAPDQLHQISDPSVTGPAAPLGGDSPRLFYRTADGLTVARTACSTGTCTLSPAGVVYDTADILVQIAGAPIPRLATATDYRGLVGAAVLRDSSGRERTILVFTDEGLGTMTDVPLDMPDLAGGGSVLDLHVGAESEDFGADVGAVTVIVVAALISRGDQREVVVGALRACGTP